MRLVLVGGSPSPWWWRASLCVESNQLVIFTMTCHDGVNKEEAVMTDNITASDATPGDVFIQLSYPQSTLDGQRARIAITDQMPGQALAVIDLTPEQLMSFMSATGTQVSGAAIPTRPERIGRRRQTTSTSLGRDADRTPEQIRDAYLADGWETVDIQATNYGTRVVARRWIADEQNSEV